MIRLGILLALLISGGFGATTSWAQNLWNTGTTLANTAVVTHVVDGDTIKVQTGGSEHTVRFIGVNTPETVKPNTPVECYGPQASNLTKKLLPVGSTVTLTMDVENTDKYGRWLRYVSINGRDVGATLLRKGAATTMRIEPNTARADEYRTLQLRAEKQDKGLWKTCR